MRALARLVGILAWMFLHASWVQAQQAISDEPLFGSTATESVGAEDKQDNGFHVLVIGDALAGGLGAGLTRMAESEDNFEVTTRFNEESGIARPELYDWSESLQKILNGKSYDAAVVLLGANDRQTIRSDPMRFPFNTPGWISAYKAQTDRILDVLKRAGVKIYWVSIPPMADPDYETAMEAILAIQKERVAAKGGVFIDIRPAFLNSDGTYTNQGPDDTGTIRKLRARDGVSFFKEGNNRMGQLVLGAIKRSGIDNQDTSRPTVATRGGSEPTVPAEPEKPLFGQRGADGTPVSFRPKDFDASAVADLVKQGAFGTGLAALQGIAQPGSAAEKLFVSGEAAAAPPGRADDFSVPQ